MKKAYWFWPVAITVVVLDFCTKRIILAAIAPGESHQVFGDYVRFTLGFNNGIAFGLSQYDSARPLLILFTIIACGGILWIYRTTDPAHRVQIVALALILGGALGNLIDRFQRARGVTDFIDVGVGMMRFWTFNVADSAITIGAILLLLSSFATGRHPAPKTEA